MKFTFNKDAIIARATQAASIASGDAAQELQNAIKGKISNSGTSSPGDPPGMQSGNLAASIQSEESSETTWKVFTKAIYAAILEFGGRIQFKTGEVVYIGSRPYWRNTIALNRDSILSGMKRKVMKAIRG